eukprot:2111297-Amphidinium_carterae.1
MGNGATGCKNADEHCPSTKTWITVPMTIPITTVSTESVAPLGSYTSSSQGKTAKTTPARNLRPASECTRSTANNSAQTQGRACWRHSTAGICLNARTVASHSVG